MNATARVQHMKDMESEFVAGEGCHVQGTLQLQRITGALPCQATPVIALDLLIINALVLAVLSSHLRRPEGPVSTAAPRLRRTNARAC